MEQLEVVICYICREPFLPNEDLQVTPCGHIFHGTCILKSVKRILKCPLCCAGVTPDDLIQIYLNFKGTCSAEMGELWSYISRIEQRITALENSQKAKCPRLELDSDSSD